MIGMKLQFFIKVIHQLDQRNHKGGNKTENHLERPINRPRAGRASMIRAQYPTRKCFVPFRFDPMTSCPSPSHGKPPFQTGDDKFCLEFSWRSLSVAQILLVLITTYNPL